LLIIQFFALLECKAPFTH